MPAPASIPHQEPHTHLKNIGRPSVPPFASSDTVVPRTTRSSRSRKAELRAQVELQKKQLAAAETAAALARTELELAQCDSEDEVDNEFEAERHSHIEQWVQHTASYVEAPNEKEVPSHKSELKELADAIIVAARTTQPTPAAHKVWDLPDFNGSNEEWLPFKRSYMDSAEQFNDVQNMARLRRTIKGAAREAIRSLLFASSEPQEILAALERRFGRPEQLVLAEVERMKDLPRISDAPRDICAFASQVSNAVTTIEALKKVQYLYSPEITRVVIEKLSPILRYRWFDFNASMGHDEPELVKLKKFLNSEADLCGSFAPPELIKKRFGQRRFPVHTTQDDEEETHIVATSSEPYKKNCFHCNGEHWLTECKNFKEATTDEKWEIAKQKRLCFKCLRLRHVRTNCKAQPCRKCKRPHHTLLHSELTRTTAPSTQQQKLAPSPCNQAKEIEDVRPVYAAADGARIYLKMMPVDIYGPKGSARVLALLDEGSTVSLLDASIASRIGATGEEKELILETVGGKIITKEKSQKMDLKIRGIHRRDKRALRGVRTVEELKLSPQYVDGKSIERCDHLKNLKNELVYEKGRPALLIGQDNWDLIVSRKIVKGKRSEPVASLTSLVLHGGHTGIASVHFINHCRINNKEESLEELIKKHFELDSIGIRERRPSNDADERALKILKESTRQLPDGRYESGLLWKSEDERLPNNYTQARNRLLGVERKLDRDATLNEEYSKQLGNLLTSAYAEEAPENITMGRTFYLPHFAVKHPLKGKIRIVFDAAAKHEGKSLNDALLPGPDLLQSLFGVLIRFREGPVAVVADVKEMFLQIQIREEDRDSLRFLWRGEDRGSKPKEYRMKSVIFGAASSPATAIYVKNINAEQHAKEHPRAARAIIRNHYMDDYLQSFSTTEEAASVADEVNQVHKKAGFILKQWASNKEEALAKIDANENIKEKRLGQEEEKTLGMRWLVQEDALAFNVGLRNTPLEVKNGNKKPTKREVTSAVMSTFDPLGLATPVLIMGKRIIQDLWRTGVQWDEEVNEEQHRAWEEYAGNVKSLSCLKIPRCLAPTTRSGEVHTFVDASETAYAAAVYWRSTADNGEVNIRLMAGKARVAPVKATSIPRLELQAALLGARLAASVCEETDLTVTSRVFWSDSTTVLQWLKADPRRFKVFIAHRLAAIEELSKPNEWRWVSTKDNPADDATRNTPRDFNEEARWFRGPAFLYGPKSDWPVKKILKQEDDSEIKKKSACTIAAVNEKEKLLDPRKFSNWWRLLRTTARVHMFIDMCRRKCNKENSEKKANETHLCIDRKYLKKAEATLIRNSQDEAFEREINSMKRNKPIERSSRLGNVDVTLNDDGILRLRSRTSKIETNGKGLPILDGREHTTQLIIEHYHRHLLHSSHATVINELRQKYWILSLREAVRKVAYKCQWCKMRRTRPQMPPPGDLPRERLAHNQPPFTCAAVDYFGPMHVTIGRRREKRWGALFTCLTTRAIHLELAASLSTSSMIMALRRMAARRGSPRVIFSDNGTNFVGANNELKNEIKNIKNEELIKAAEQEGILWKFIPPGAPHMGGAWERMVRSVKVALVAVLGEKSPPEEVLYTLLTEVEHTVNSRPLTHLSADPRDEEALTPNHFLIGRSCGAAVLGEFDDSCLVGRADWKTVQHMADHFWRRWMREYLPTLMPRRTDKGKNTDFREGDIVIIADATLPRNTWPRGQIEKTFPGPDGRIRIVDVRTRGGTLRRPVSRLIVVNQTPPPEDGVSGPPNTGGRLLATSSTR
ncbi:uncharacterized protein [Epargyreus clarus]|uniref:uncharacterized protein n=1 Tax=Epargyreus clarus TaxID=520877 RepID=UPI003C2C0644